MRRYTILPLSALPAPLPPHPPVPAPPRPRLPRRLAVRAALLATAVTTCVLAAPWSAQAHVEIEPAQVQGGDFAVVSIRVPNERDNASTARLRVLFPQDHPLGSVQTTAAPGWKVSTATRRLKTPLHIEGARVDRVVSEVTWTATAGGIRPGQFKDFALDLGPLPTKGVLRFVALQTYSTGELVRWNQVSAAGAPEPEHPAPTLTIGPSSADAVPTPAAAAAAAGSSDSTHATVNAPATTPVADVSAAAGGSMTTVLAAVALLVALGAAAAAGLAWRREQD
jgi:uncharacterized protein YcnI